MASSFCSRRHWWRSFHVPADERGSFPVMMFSGRGLLSSSTVMPWSQSSWTSLGARLRPFAAGSQTDGWASLLDCLRDALWSTTDGAGRFATRWHQQRHPLDLDKQLQLESHACSRQILTQKGIMSDMIQRCFLTLCTHLSKWFTNDSAVCDLWDRFCCDTHS